MARFNLDDYETVEDRLAKFWGDHPNGRVLTDLVAYGDKQFIVRAEVYLDREDSRPVASGYAEEQVTDRGVNQTSALENGETSAIGRALANCGYATKGKRPSREEMAKVERRTSVQAPQAPALDAKEMANLAAVIAATAAMDDSALKECWNANKAALDVETAHGTLRNAIQVAKAQLDAEVAA